MSRLDSQLTKDALDSVNVVSVDLLRVSFGCSNSTFTDKATCELNGSIWTDDITLTSFGNDITYDIDKTGSDVTFFSSSDLLEIGKINESLGMELDTIDLTLSGVSGQWIQLSQQIELLNRPVELWRALLDANTYEVIGEPFKYFAGVVVSGAISKVEGGDGSTVVISCSNEFYNFEIVRGFRANVEDHQRFFPNDTGFKNTTSVEKKIQWGKSG